MREANVPEWYIASCKKIKYLFPKAHAAAYVTMSLRVAYYKVYYKEAYYAAFYTVRADGFDYELMCMGIERAREAIDEIDAKGKEATAKEKDVKTILELVVEMYCRGILLFARFLFHEGALQWLFNAGKPLMVALIIIYLLQPIVNWLSQNLHLPRALAVLISYCFLLAILAFVVGTLIPAIVTNVAEILPKDYTALLDHIAAMPWIRNVIHSGLPQKLAQNIPRYRSWRGLLQIYQL